MDFAVIFANFPSISWNNTYWLKIGSMVPVVVPFVTILPPNKMSQVEPDYWVSIYKEPWYVWDSVIIWKTKQTNMKVQEQISFKNKALFDEGMLDAC